jgi:hypothetical protein
MQKCYSNAQFQAKTSEIALRELAGNLVFRSDQITTYPLTEAAHEKRHKAPTTFLSMVVVFLTG